MNPLLQKASVNQEVRQAALAKRNLSQYYAGISRILRDLYHLNRQNLLLSDFKAKMGTLKLESGKPVLSISEMDRLWDALFVAHIIERKSARAARFCGNEDSFEKINIQNLFERGDIIIPRGHPVGVPGGNKTSHQRIVKYNLKDIPSEVLMQELEVRNQRQKEINEISGEITQRESLIAAMGFTEKELVTILSELSEYRTKLSVLKAQ